MQLNEKGTRYHLETKILLMKDIKFPVKFIFKISSLANDFRALDANDNMVAYVRQKMFKLKEEISVYEDETRKKVNFKIKADKWLDFSTAYSFTDSEGTALGKVVRKGWASLWKARYELIDQQEKIQYHISEEKAWVKVMDSLMGEIPIINIFTGYFFNPSYILTDLNGDIIARLKKESSFTGRRFEVQKVKEIDQDDQERIILGLMMMILLERRRG